MGRTNQPSWAEHILKLLEQAREKDRDQKVFGSGSHQYRLAAPVSEKKIQAFESKYGIRLPEEYRNFLMLVGNGGAGPYYGIYGLKDLKEELEDNDEYLPLEESVIYPKMSDEDWDKAADPEGKRQGEELHPYRGVLPIGSQGCTLMTGLMLSGPYCGQVVYFDMDFCGKPFFVREKGFLAWYERWLREVIAGYDDEGVGFGICLDGNPQQLMELYGQTDDPEEKVEIITSYYKFKNLPKEQQDYFKQVCDREPNMKVRMKLIKMMAFFHVEGLSEEVEKLWECGAYGEAVSVIAETGGMELKGKWCERIFEKLPELYGDAFRDACFIFRVMADDSEIHAGRFKEALARKDLDRNDRAVLFQCIRSLKGKDEVLDYFLDDLPAEEDIPLLCYAVQAMEGVKDRRLQEVYIHLLDQYRGHENAKFDYEGSQMIRNGSCFGASRPEGQVVSCLMREFDLFGLDYSGAWKMLMDDIRWEAWKQQYFGHQGSETQEKEDKKANS